jgi:DNA-binding GntR family transcriptional regulator
MDQYLLDHEQIMLAIRDRDHKSAESLMARHIVIARKNMLDN